MVTMCASKRSATRVYFLTTAQFGCGTRVIVTLKRRFDAFAHDVDLGKEKFIFRFLNESRGRRSRLRFPQQKWRPNDTFSWMICVSFDHLERRHSVLS
jgi:hypothetical protein